MFDWNKLTQTDYVLKAAHQSSDRPACLRNKALYNLPTIPQRRSVHHISRTIVFRNPKSLIMHRDSKRYHWTHHADNLARHPEIGRRGRILGTREIVINDIPCILVYQITGKDTRIFAVMHTVRKWPQNFKRSR